MSSNSKHSEVVSLLTQILQLLVDNPDTVNVTVDENEGKTTILRVNMPEGPNMGRLIGKQGRTARALRVIMVAAGRKHQMNYQLDINGQQVGDGDVG